MTLRQLPDAAQPVAGAAEFYAFGGYSYRRGTGNGFWRYFDSNRNWQEIYPQGFLPEFHPKVNDYSAAGGFRTSFGGWAADAGVSCGLNRFDYDLENTNNPSLGPCLDTPPLREPTGYLGNARRSRHPESDFVRRRLAAAQRSHRAG